MKIQRNAPTFTVVPFRNNVLHNIVPTSFHVIDAVIVFVIQFSNLPVTRTHARTQLHDTTVERNNKKIHTKLTTTTTFPLNIYYDFHAMCSLIYLACVWILACSTESTLISARNACIHTPTHYTYAIWNRMIFLLVRCVVIVNDFLVPRTLAVVVAFAIVLVLFTILPHHQCHNIDKMCMCAYFFLPVYSLLCVTTRHRHRISHSTPNVCVAYTIAFLPFNLYTQYATPRNTNTTTTMTTDRPTTHTQKIAL